MKTIIILSHSSEDKIGSTTRVTIQCPTCAAVRVTDYRRVLRQQHTRCQRCMVRGKVKDIAGKEFGRLKVLRRLPTIKPGRTLWECQCSCGNIVAVMRQSLVSGLTASCGCKRLESVRRNRGERHPQWGKRGSASPAWKGGKRTKTIRGYAESREWRVAVFTRDNYTCRSCSRRGGRLNAHHLYSFATHAELRFDVNNGATLCTICHRQFHNQFGNRNTPEQFNQFIRSQPNRAGVAALPPTPPSPRAVDS